MVLGSVLAMRGWIRWNRETPLASSTAISPSSTACAGGDVVRHHGQLGILPLAAQPAARLQADLFVVHEGDGAHAVPLDLEQPVLAARRRSASVAIMGSMAAGISASCAPLRRTGRAWFSS
jgi:hypothetical protein